MFAQEVEAFQQSEKLVDFERNLRKNKKQQQQQQQQKTQNKTKNSNSGTWYLPMTLKTKNTLCVSNQSQIFQLSTVSTVQQGGHIESLWDRGYGRQALVS